MSCHGGFGGRGCSVVLWRVRWRGCSVVEGMGRG